MRKLVWQLIRYSRRWFHGRVAVCRLFAFHWPALTCRREKKMFELQPNVFRNFKWLPTLIYTLTRLIYSREIFEMFKTFLVFFFTRPAVLTCHNACNRSAPVTFRWNFYLVMTSDGCRKRVIINLKVLGNLARMS